MQMSAAVMRTLCCVQSHAMTRLQYARFLKYYSGRFTAVTLKDHT